MRLAKSLPHKESESVPEAPVAQQPLSWALPPPPAGA
jgi:hypothetical protein